VSADLLDRFCPLCGQDASARFCQRDGTATVARKRLQAGAIDYAPGHIVEGRYRVTGRLGCGGFGAVFSAVHTGTGQEVALKVLHVDLSFDNTAIVRRFWQEAQITSQLRHPNTVRVFDVGQTEEGAFYLAMEHLRGETLTDLLDKRARHGRSLTEAEARDIGVQMLRSLQEAHKAGLVHRDLKPGNVMLVQGDEGLGPLVKVLDFGIARRADSSLTGEGSALGTPAYMSPEQCRGIGVDARSDLYALGAMLFRCVTGRVPFADENALTVMFHHAETPVPDPRTVAPSPLSAGFARCIMRAMAKRPDERYADARDMREALQATAGHYEAPTQLLEPLAEPARAAAATAAPSRPPRSRKVWMLAMVMGLAGLAALLWAARAPAPPVAVPALEPHPRATPVAERPAESPHVVQPPKSSRAMAPAPVPIPAQLAQPAPVPNPAPPHRKRTSPDSSKSEVRVRAVAPQAPAQASATSKPAEAAPPKPSEALNARPSQKQAEKPTALD